ncbi:unnamed protein product [Callosobruchus maculatus]|uniref:Uncharacterized protein n=1 Tax=Callosobruchus maculatus TaxID=64391 RepID=A0A653C7M4_CALMS|nr:unnamed protein product [Callosobruchus maculatus]
MSLFRGENDILILLILAAGPLEVRSVDETGLIKCHYLGVLLFGINFILGNYFLGGENDILIFLILAAGPLEVRSVDGTGLIKCVNFWHQFHLGELFPWG